MRYFVQYSLMAVLAFPMSAVTRDPSGYERILVPLVAVHARPGAFGSVWQSELTMRNTADATAHVFQHECAFFCTCEADIPCTPVEVSPRSVIRMDLETATNNFANRGAFVYVNRSRANDFVAQLRIRDLSRGDSWGTEVPLVRDVDTRRTTTHLLDIPIARNYRQHLRVYGISSPTGTADVLVRAFDDHDALLAESVLRLQPGTVRFDEPASIPTDAQLMDVPAYAEIPSLHDFLGTPATAIRLEIRPLTPGLKFWPMVSITNNTTQHVTLVTPQ